MRRIVAAEYLSHDEYRFMIYPLVLGTGKRFFKDGNDKNMLQLKRAATSSTGVTMLVCEPAAYASADRERRTSYDRRKWSYEWR